VAPAAAAFLKNAPRQPFYLEVGFTETHRRFHPPTAPQDARYCLPPAPLPDTPETRADMAAFKASAAALDQGVGEVLAALEAAGLAENTLVLSTTDHGIPFPAMKCNLTDHGTGVSFMLRGPGGLRGGKVVDAMVSHIDFFPTVCDLLAIRRPEWLEGRSLMPLVRGEKDEINDEVFGEITYHVPYEPRRAVRTRRWKYIRHFDGRTTPVLPNCDDGPSKEYWIKAGWQTQQSGAERLYDLVFDPNETRNLATDPARPRPNHWIPNLTATRDCATRRLSSSSV
jgi:arylsulfatase A-like enzyme